MALFTVIGCYLLGSAELECDLLAIKSSEKLNAERGAMVMFGAIEDIIRDLRFIASNSELKRTINDPTPSHLNELVVEFSDFSRAKQVYDQLRWLDETGMERVRVDLIGDRPVNVVGDKLQSKVQRYYFDL